MTPVKLILDMIQLVFDMLRPLGGGVTSVFIKDNNQSHITYWCHCGLKYMVKKIDAAEPHHQEQGLYCQVLSFFTFAQRASAKANLFTCSCGQLNQIGQQCVSTAHIYSSSVNFQSDLQLLQVFGTVWVNLNILYWESSLKLELLLSQTSWIHTHMYFVAKLYQHPLWYLQRHHLQCCAGKNLWQINSSQPFKCGMHVCFSPNLLGACL